MNEIHPELSKWIAIEMYSNWFPQSGTNSNSSGVNWSWPGDSIRTDTYTVRTQEFRQESQDLRIAICALERKHISSTFAPPSPAIRILCGQHPAFSNEKDRPHGSLGSWKMFVFKKLVFFLFFLLRKGPDSFASVPKSAATQSNFESFWGGGWK